MSGVLFGSEVVHFFYKKLSDTNTIHTLLLYLMDDLYGLSFGIFFIKIWTAAYSSSNKVRLIEAHSNWRIPPFAM